MAATRDPANQRTAHQTSKLRNGQMLSAERQIRRNELGDFKLIPLIVSHPQSGFLPFLPPNLSPSVSGHPASHIIVSRSPTPRGYHEMPPTRVFVQPVSHNIDRHWRQIRKGYEMWLHKVEGPSQQPHIAKENYGGSPRRIRSHWMASMVMRQERSLAFSISMCGSGGFAHPLPQV